MWSAYSWPCCKQRLSLNLTVIMLLVCTCVYLECVKVGWVVLTADISLTPGISELCPILAAQLRVAWGCWLRFWDNSMNIFSYSRNWHLEFATCHMALTWSSSLTMSRTWPGVSLRCRYSHQYAWKQLVIFLNAHFVYPMVTDVFGQHPIKSRNIVFDHYLNCHFTAFYIVH